MHYASHQKPQPQSIDEQDICYWYLITGFPFLPAYRQKLNTVGNKLDAIIVEPHSGHRIHTNAAPISLMPLNSTSCYFRWVLLKCNVRMLWYSVTFPTGERNACTLISSHATDWYMLLYYLILLYEATRYFSNDIAFGSAYRNRANARWHSPWERKTQRYAGFV